MLLNVVNKRAGEPQKLSVVIDTNHRSIIMRKTKKIIALICAIFICHMAFSNPKLSADQKKMGNLLVRINQNFMLSEPCLAFNPNIKKDLAIVTEIQNKLNKVLDLAITLPPFHYLVD